MQRRVRRSVKAHPGRQLFSFHANHLSVHLSMPHPKHLFLTQDTYFHRGIIWQVILFLVGGLLVLSLLWARYVFPHFILIPPFGRCSTRCCFFFPATFLTIFFILSPPTDLVYFLSHPMLLKKLPKSLSKFLSKQL